MSDYNPPTTLPGSVWAPIHLSVIIPAYNEEKRLAKTLKEIDDYLKKQNFESEIIVVSDGSKDRTCEVVENLKSQIANLRLICEKINRGKGYGVKIGMLNSKGKFRLFTDADNSTPISEIEKFWPEFEKGADVVIASRDIKGAILDPPQPLFRRFVGEVFKYLRKIIVGLWEIEDTQCGFKCFKGEVAEKIFPECKIERFAFDPEILLIAKKMGFKIKEVPIYWKNDLESKVKFKSMIKMLVDLFQIRFNLLTRKYG
jgi:dolichyl-phosphate beta-glucosyltransferase